MMKIGIIGVGHFGKTLALKLAKAGHDVAVAGSGEPEKISIEVLATGAQAVTVQQAAQNKDVIILSIPFKAYKDLPENLLQELPEHVVVMDTSNYYPLRDGELAGLQGKTESEYISETLGRPVIKVFNNILEYSLKHKGKAAGEHGRIAIPVAGDNKEHKKVAALLVDQTGFDTVDGGSLSESWRQQPGTPAYCTELTAEELKQALADARKEKIPAVRDYIMDRIMSSETFPSHEEIVALNRSASAGNLR